MSKPEMDWETAKKQGIKDREEFLKIYPSMRDWIENCEKHYGAFMGITSISFTDERCVFLQKWERTYVLDFSNPANPDESKEKSVVLSYEAMNALFTLYIIQKSDEDTRRFWSAFGKSKDEIEKLVKEESDAGAA